MMGPNTWCIETKDFTCNATSPVRIGHIQSSRGLRLCEIEQLFCTLVHPLGLTGQNTFGNVVRLVKNTNRTANSSPVCPYFPYADNSSFWFSYSSLLEPQSLHLPMILSDFSSWLEKWVGCRKLPFIHYTTETRVFLTPPKLVANSGIFFYC